MKDTHRPRPHSATANQIGRESPVSRLRSARRPSGQRISDAVVAAYIHDISERGRRRSHVSNRSDAERGERRAALTLPPTQSIQPLGRLQCGAVPDC
jgi:hypothetical protein